MDARASTRMNVDSEGKAVTMEIEARIFWVVTARGDV